jgi:hypothetical protein
MSCRRQSDLRLLRSLYQGCPRLPDSWDWNIGRHRPLCGASLYCHDVSVHASHPAGDLAEFLRILRHHFRQPGHCGVRFHRDGRHHICFDTDRGGGFYDSMPASKLR